MTRRRGLWLSGLVAAGLLAALAVLDARLKEIGGPGIIPFELAGSRSRARTILDEWGAAGRPTAELSLWLDFAFLTAYGAFFALAAWASRDLARRHRWSRLVAPRWAVVGVPVGAAVFDAVENVFLLLVIGDPLGEAWSRLAAVFAVGKFTLSFITLAYLLAVLARLGSEGARSATERTR